MYRWIIYSRLAVFVEAKGFLSGQVKCLQFSTTWSGKFETTLGIIEEEMGKHDFFHKSSDDLLLLKDRISPPDSEDD